MLSVDTTNATAQLGRFEAALQRYAVVTLKSTEEILEKKGRDLGIKLYEEFRARQWGGAGKGRGRTLATAEAEQRYREGRGTRLRPAIKAAYLKERAALRHQKRALANTRARGRLREKYLGRELAARGSGIGVLAASFLWYRNRTTRTGIVQVPNRTGRPLGRVERGERSLRIVGLGNIDKSGSTGIGIVDTRYGLTARALARSEADIQVYLDRKARETAAKAFGDGGTIR